MLLIYRATREDGGPKETQNDDYINPGQSETRENQDQEIKEKSKNL